MRAEMWVLSGASERRRIATLGDPNSQGGESESMAKNRDGSRRQLYAYKGDRCAYCGKSVQQELDDYGSMQRVFELHHVDPTQKHPNYDNLIRRVISTEQIDEVDKCILLCRVCHGRAEAVGVQAEIELTVRVHFDKRDYEVSERLKGLVIIKHGISPRWSFMSNETPKARPYTIQYGSKKPRFIWGTEVEGTLGRDVFPNIRRHREVTIRTLNGDLMMRLTYNGDAEATLERDICFPFLESVLCGDRLSDQQVWVRNGAALIKGGAVRHSGIVRAVIALPQLPIQAQPT
jgi:hypothetical protein